MHRIRTTLDLAGRSWRVVREHPRLLVHPLLGTLSGLAILAALLVYVAGMDVTPDATGEVRFETTQYLVFLLAAALLAVVRVLFQASLVADADRVLRGEPARFGSGLDRAVLRMLPLIGWAIVQLVVGSVLDALRDKGILGRIIAGFAQTAWNVVTFFTVPVIVLEDAGTLRAIRRSKDIIKSTWGETITALVGFGLLNLLYMVACGLVGGMLIMTLRMIGFIIAVLLFVTGLMVLAALHGVFVAALYRYATSGQAAPAFGEGALRGAFSGSGGSVATHNAPSFAPPLAGWEPVPARTAPGPVVPESAAWQGPAGAPGPPPPPPPPAPSPRARPPLPPDAIPPPDPFA